MSVSVYETQWDAAEDARLYSLPYAEEDAHLIWKEMCDEDAFLIHFRDGEPEVAEFDSRLLLKGILGRIPSKRGDSSEIISFSPANSYKRKLAVGRRDTAEDGRDLNSRRVFNDYSELVAYREGRAPTIQDGIDEMDAAEDELEQFESYSMYNNGLTRQEKRLHHSRAINKEGKIDITGRRDETVAKQLAEAEQYRNSEGLSRDDAAYGFAFDPMWEEDDYEGPTESEIDGYYRENYEYSLVMPSGR